VEQRVFDSLAVFAGTFDTSSQRSSPSTASGRGT
jgi:hypothetical protein